MGRERERERETLDKSPVIAPHAVPEAEHVILISHLSVIQRGVLGLKDRFLFFPEKQQGSRCREGEAHGNAQDIRKYSKQGEKNQLRKWPKTEHKLSLAVICFLSCL